MSGTTGFELLVNDQEVYPVEFVNRAKRISKHWINSSWPQRESDLRHDLVCCLLCNLEVRQGAQDMLSKSLQKEASHRIAMEVGPMKRKNEESDDDEDDDKPMLVCEKSESDESEQESKSESESDEEDGHRPDPNEKHYRYILIEGTMEESKVQYHYCKTLGIPKRRKLYDIVDTGKRKLIEVKVTMNPPQRVKEFNANLDTDSNVGLCCLNYRTFTFTYVNCDKMPGEDKAINFLINRATRMGVYGLTDSPILEEKSMEEAIFNVPVLNDFISQFEKICIEVRGSSAVPPNYCQGKEALYTITPKLLFDKLTKPKEVEGPPIRWKGKLTPHYMLKGTLVEGDDVECCDQFMEPFFMDIINKEMDQGLTEILDAVVHVINEWGTNQYSSKNFRIYCDSDEKRTRKYPQELLIALGIGEKRRGQQLKKMDYQQEDFDPLVPHKYETWFDDIMRTFATGNEDGIRAKIFTMEKQDRIEFHRQIQEVIERYNNRLSMTKIAVFQSYISNFYSRLGMSYLARKDGSDNHGSIAVFPLLTNVLDGDNKEVKICYGFCIRGPQHARRSTDQISMLVVEQVKPEFKETVKQMYSHAKFLLADGNTYLVRQTSLKKVDCTHLTFVRNAAFCPMNLIGEMVLNIRNENSSHKVKQRFAKITNDERYSKFYIERVIEATMMAVTGNTRDEGYFANLRKLFMILLNESRDETCLMWTESGLCEKANENLLDNPFSMYFQNTVLYCLCKLHSKVSH
jgi:hypothetical protein